MKKRTAHSSSRTGTRKRYKANALRSSDDFHYAETSRVNRRLATVFGSARNLQKNKNHDFSTYSYLAAILARKPEVVFAWRCTALLYRRAARLVVSAEHNDVIAFFAKEYPHASARLHPARPILLYTIYVYKNAYIYI